MNKPIHPAVAEHVLQENHALREVAREALAVIERLRPAGNGMGTIVRLKAALSQQAEPVEPAPTQDERKLPEPYGWVAVGGFFTDREKAIQAAEKTPCIEVYSRPQLLAAARPAQTEQQPDPVLCDFYGAKDYPGLVGELVAHVKQLQEAAKRNVKPWEDTFPPTLLPAYIKRIEEGTAPVVQAKPVPAQDTREAEVHTAIRNLRCIAKTVLSSEARSSMRADLESAIRLLIARPAQTGQQPCPVCDGVGELNQFGAGNEYRCESCDGNRMVRMAAAPIVQTAQLPEQTGLVEAANRVVTWLDWSGGLPVVGGQSLTRDIQKLRAALAAQGDRDE